ncbi:hypothetical protein GXM_07571 [Nostoc sphaeroides CCNUC1]|uniref:Uncharacterized protein n=1 Tax=Nostoc sphaeroides CCNUC1 TaxID=2653204 RepID=A0A5P8WBB1_9NOSO|nr:hypothetical protein GXM_07571 [Nostoc sphaeroides CCNUC1]
MTVVDIALSAFFYSYFIDSVKEFPKIPGFNFFPPFHRAGQLLKFLGRR